MTIHLGSALVELFGWETEKSSGGIDLDYCDIEWFAM